jgi:hypothetical protein
MVRRIRTIVLTLLGVVVLLVGGIAFILYPQVLKPHPEASYPAPLSAAEANLQDIEYLGRLLEIDRSFSPAARMAFSTGIADLEGQAAELSPAELEMASARLAALADNGHTNVRGVGHGFTRNALPIRLNHFAEGYFVTKARPELAALLGAQVIAIDDQTPEALLDALSPYTGGPQSLRREFAAYMLISPQALNAAGLTERDDRVTLTLRLANGQETTREIIAEDGPANGPAPSDRELQNLRRRHWPQRDLSPIASPIDVGEWETVLDPQGELPLYLRNPDRHYWREYIPELNAVYVQINVVIDEAEGPSLQAFLTSVIAELQEKPVRNAIIDLRFNPGGNGTLTTDFTTALPQALPADGKIYVLTSGNTFSAAIITLARLKHFGGERAVIVGEPIGDRERFWAEGGMITLPNSGLQVAYATAMHDWEHGCRFNEILDCYVVNYVIGVPAGSLAPNLPVAPRFADYAAGKDPALLAIAAAESGDRP